MPDCDGGEGQTAWGSANCCCHGFHIHKLLTLESECVGSQHNKALDVRLCFSFMEKR